MSILYNILTALGIWSATKDSDSGISNYCLAPLNMSDCGLSQSLVYSYFNSFSKCRVAAWRGCPSDNLFFGKADCTKRCMKHVEDVEPYRMCSRPLNTEKCRKYPEKVFTYSKEKKTCVEADWYGCSTLNKFDNEQLCVEICQKPKYDWHHESVNLHTEKEFHSLLEKMAVAADLDD